MIPSSSQVKQNLLEVTHSIREAAHHQICEPNIVKCCDLCAGYLLVQCLAR